MSTAFTVATGPLSTSISNFARRRSCTVRSPRCAPRRHGAIRMEMENSGTSGSAPGLSTTLVDLPTGLTMEVIHAAGGLPGELSKRPLILVPGSYHAAWCWKYFQPYFASRGYPSYAISLRGSGLSTTGGTTTAIDLATHLSDLDALYAHLNLSGTAPVLIGHSTGGLLVQHWSAASPKGKFSGGVLMASKPPIDHNDLTWRLTSKYGLRYAWRITTGFAFKRFVSNLDLTREVFFSPKHTPGYDEALEGDDVLREYMRNFADLSKLPTDLKSTQAPVSAPGDLFGKTLVLGGERDKIIDLEALQETAEFFGVKGTEILLKDAPHDLMLSSQWRTAADTILDWLDNSLLTADAPALGVSQQLE